MRHHGCVVALGAVLAVGCASGGAPRVSPAPAPAPPPQPERKGDPLRGLSHEQLQGVLWVQTSAEFEAVLTSTFAAARAALEPALDDETWTAALEQQGDFSARPPAVIVDVDETMLDNSPLQAQSVLEATAFCDEAWDAWVAQKRARALPGALAFTRAAAGLGVEVFYVTNRDKVEEAATIENLKCAERTAAGECLAFPNADPEHVLVLGEAPAEGEKPWTSDKTARRAHVAARHRILLLVGDDLRDFVTPPSGASVEVRRELARRYAALWGTRWFILPNPLYGSWERALPGSNLGDAQFLEGKRGLVEGFREPQPGGCQTDQK